jgi:hypothetical protein
MFPVESNSASFEGANPQLPQVIDEQSFEDIVWEAILYGVVPEFSGCENAQSAIRRNIDTVLRIDQDVFHQIIDQPVFRCQARKVFSIELAKTVAEATEPVVPF